MEDSEQFMEQIQDLVEEEERLHKQNRMKFIMSNIGIASFGFLSCLCILFIAIDFNKEPCIPILMACTVFMALCIYYAIIYGRKYYYKQRDIEIARRDRARAQRVPLTPQDEKFEEESDSRSSPADLTDPVAEEPSNLAQTESSTLSDQTSTQESSEKTSLSDSTKGTFTITAIIEHGAAGKTSTDTLSEVKEKVASKNEDEDPKPSTSSQPDSADCLTIDADPEEDIVKVRHRRPTPE